jgi:exosortase
VTGESRTRDARPASFDLDLALRLAVIAAALLACLPAVRLLTTVWDGSDFFGHAYAVPAAAAFVLWRERAEIAASLREGVPPAWGLPVALAASLFAAVSVYGDIVFAAGLSISILLAAAAFALGGMRLLRAVSVAAGLLLFVVPPPGFVMNRLLFELKLRVTEWSTAALHALGYSVASRGNEIFVPGEVLFVADACSGLTSIVTLLPLAVLVAWVLGRGVWRRVVVVASVVPLALLANVIRVTATVMLLPHLGPQIAQGLLHEAFGMATYVLGTLSVMGIAWALRS